MNVLSSILSELCLLPNIKGGFEIDGPVKVKQASTVSAAPGKTTNKLQKGNITVATLSIFHEKYIYMFYKKIHIFLRVIIIQRQL